MKVVIINGQNHKGSTYRIARMPAEKISKMYGNVKSGIKTRGYFFMMRFVQMNIIKKEADLAYWKRKGWDKKERPWK